MAAILCKPIGSFFEFVCTAPCKLCSNSCTSLCTSPLSAYTVVTFISQIPIVVVGAMELGGLFGGGGGCKGSEWLLGMLLVAIVHMVTGVYLPYRVTNGTDEALRDRHTSWERISYLLCHDPWIAFYILACLFFIVWLCVGSAWSIQGIMDDSSACGNDLEDRVGIALGFGWFFLFVGPTVLSCNLCCVCCDKKDYAADDAAFAAKAAAKENANNNNNNNKNNNNNNNSRANDNNANNNADIETPNPPQPEPEPEPETRTKMKDPPRTYSVDGVPIVEGNTTRSNDVVEAEAVVEETLPPAMLPPKGYTTTAAQAAEIAEDTVGSITKTVGGWFSSSKSNKKGDDPKPPDTKATLY